MQSHLQCYIAYCHPHHILNSAAYCTCRVLNFGLGWAHVTSLYVLREGTVKRWTGCFCAPPVCCKWNSNWWKYCLVLLQRGPYFMISQCVCDLLSSLWDYIVYSIGSVVREQQPAWGWGGVGGWCFCSHGEGSIMVFCFLFGCSSVSNSSLLFVEN